MSDVLICGSEDVNITLDKNKNIKVYQYLLNKSININIILEEGSTLEYYLSDINYDNNKIKINIVHNGKNSKSNIYNHLCNVKDDNLILDVNGIVGKNISGCITNQENQIINLKEGKSTIKPNLLIDNFDIESSHSAYIGKFKDEVLFYLQSRGISKKVANRLLLNSFLLFKDSDEKIVEDFKKEINKI